MRIDPSVMSLSMSLAIATLLVSEPALAGTDTTFNFAQGSVENVLTIGFGLIDVIARFDWKLFAAGVGVGLIWLHCSSHRVSNEGNADSK